MKKLILFFICIIGIQQSAWSACTIDSGSRRDITIVLPSTINKPVHSTPGTILWESGWKSSGSIAQISCNNTGEYTMGYLTSLANIYGLAPGFSDVFNTSIPGVGMRVYVCKDSSCSPPPWGAYRQKAITGTIDNKTAYEINIGKGPWYGVTPQFFMQLIATGGNIGNGTLSYGGGKFAAFNYGPNEIGHLFVSGSTVVQGMSCLVNADSKAINVNMPPVALNTLKETTGSVPSSSTPFNINLTCEPGIRAYYMISGTTALTNVLANSTGENMARGIGIELFQGDTGSATAIPINQFIQYNTLPTPNENYAISIPLIARYYRTAANLNEVSAGQVRILATFTMSYQ